MKIDLIQSIKVPIDLVENNTGQIPGVKENPREMTVNEFNKLKKSLKRDANMTAISELKIFPLGDKWVTIGGNMRLQAMRELGWKEVIAKPIPADTDAETLNRYILLDNANFGKWDFDKLANEWDMSLLDDCAINIPGLGELAEETDEEKAPKNIADSLMTEYRLEIILNSEREQEQLYNELTAKGYICRVLTL